MLDLKGTDTGSRTRIAGDWSWDGRRRHRSCPDRRSTGSRPRTASSPPKTATRRRPHPHQHLRQPRLWRRGRSARRLRHRQRFAHRVVFGGDISFTHQDGLRDGTVPPAGESLPDPRLPGDRFHARRAVRAATRSLAATGRCTLVPGAALRRLRSRRDRRSAAADLRRGGPVRLACLAQARRGGEEIDEFRLFANYAQGFKAPSPSQVNQFFENPAPGYKGLPNPDLEPETSRTHRRRPALTPAARSVSHRRHRRSIGKYKSFHRAGRNRQRARFPTRRRPRQSTSSSISTKVEDQRASRRAAIASTVEGGITGTRRALPTPKATDRSRRRQGRRCSTVDPLSWWSAGSATAIPTARFGGCDRDAQRGKGLSRRTAGCYAVPASGLEASTIARCHGLRAGHRGSDPACRGVQPLRPHVRRCGTMCAGLPLPASPVNDAYAPCPGATASVSAEPVSDPNRQPLGEG